MNELDCNWIVFILYFWKCFVEVFLVFEFLEMIVFGVFFEKWLFLCSWRVLCFLVLGVNFFGSVYFLYFGRFGKCFGVFLKFLFVGFWNSLGFVGEEIVRFWVFVWFCERVMFLGFVLSLWEVEVVVCRENSWVWVFFLLCESFFFWKEKGVKKERKSVSEGDF